MTINVKQSITTTGAQPAIELSRHSRPDYSIEIQIGGGGDVTVESTLDKINQSGVTVNWNALSALTNVVADDFSKIENMPLEAIRLNVTAVTDTVVFHVMQNT